MTNMSKFNFSSDYYHYFVAAARAKEAEAELLQKYFEEVKLVIIKLLNLMKHRFSELIYANLTAFINPW